MKNKCENCGQYKLLSMYGVWCVLGLALFFPALIFVVIIPPLGILLWVISAFLFLSPVLKPLVKALGVNAWTLCTNCHHKTYENGN